MKLSEIINALNLKVASANADLNKEVSGVYTSDLLSDVMANSKKDNLWVTLQTHLNTVAIAVLKELSGIIIVLNKEADSDMLKKAADEKIPILKTEMNSFQVSGKLYELGLR
jgi:predicted transcriptional regulator